MEKKELKPCPFCGHKAEEFSNGIRCVNKWCFAKVEVNSDLISKSDLIYNWNSRI